MNEGCHWDTSKEWVGRGELPDTHIRRILTSSDLGGNVFWFPWITKTVCTGYECSWPECSFTLQQLSQLLLGSRPLHRLVVFLTLLCPLPHQPAVQAPVAAAQAHLEASVARCAALEAQLAQLTGVRGTGSTQVQAPAPAQQLGCALRGCSMHDCSAVRGRLTAMGALLGYTVHVCDAAGPILAGQAAAEMQDCRDNSLTLWYCWAHTASVHTA